MPTVLHFPEVMCQNIVGEDNVQEIVDAIGTAGAKYGLAYVNAHHDKQLDAVDSLRSRRQSFRRVS